MTDRTCMNDECDGKHFARGFCRRHYQRWCKANPDAVGKHGKNPEMCVSRGCDLKPTARGLCKRHYAQGRHRGEFETKPCSVGGCERAHYGKSYCWPHYERWRKHGDPGPVEALKAPKGAGYVDRNGYRYLQTGGRRIAEHRAVMEQILGRLLERWETVHHINGNRLDNRPENLQLRIGGHGVGAAFQCLDCGSANIAGVELEGSGAASGTITMPAT